MQYVDPMEQVQWHYRLARASEMQDVSDNMVALSKLVHKCTKFQDYRAGRFEVVMVSAVHMYVVFVERGTLAVLV